MLEFSKSLRFLWDKNFTTPSQSLYLKSIDLAAQSVVGVWASFIRLWSPKGPSRYHNATYWKVSLLTTASGGVRLTSVDCVRGNSTVLPDSSRAGSVCKKASKPLVVRVLQFKKLGTIAIGVFGRFE